MDPTTTDASDIPMQSTSEGIHVGIQVDVPKGKGSFINDITQGGGLAFL